MSNGACRTGRSDGQKERGFVSFGARVSSSIGFLAALVLSARRSWRSPHQLFFLVIGAFLLSRRGVLAPVLSVGQESQLLQEVEQKVKGSKVFLVSKAYCPFCQKAKEVLSSLGVAFDLLELVDVNKQPLVDDPEAVLDYMQRITGARTVPRLFIAGKFIGGCDHPSVETETDLLLDSTHLFKETLDSETEERMVLSNVNNVLLTEDAETLVCKRTYLSIAEVDNPAL